ncbi:hypothetical protein J8F10_28330 [Gemmata sp. G18]|uniref:Carboxypeptidase regulatory-like domain-containing protein n=1 Tax=Gemmata palustris TaxID=2822762 RepID=A0ABS5BZL5_9BACT|nr:hypothetical protein [Gemmata palustris]MBP3959170.1 hypothetical protein [Gemmata palustris]
MRRLASAFLLALPLLVGCDGEKSAEVSGTVTIDGKPLPEGEIIFESPDGSKTPAAGPIKNGAYTVSVAPGSKKVKITASRPTKKPDPVMGAAAREAAIGPEFNQQTKLTAEVKAGSNAEVNFQVKALP